MFLIYLDILGFDKLAEEISNLKGIRAANVRNDFIRGIQDRIQAIESKGRLVGKKYGGSDDWLLATDSIDKVYSCVYEILDHNTGYEDYEKIPLEIAIGKGEYDKWAKYDGKNLILQNETINFLKTNIVSYFRDWYKTKHLNKSIKNTFIVITQSVYDDLEILDRMSCEKIEYGNSKGNDTDKFFTADPAKFQNRGKVLEFLEKIGYPGSKQYGRMDCVYVPPLEYEEIKRTLHENRLVFITGTQEYGKTYTAVRIMWEYYNNGYEPRWIKGSELLERDKVRQTLEDIEAVLKPKHIIYFEDPFGKTEYEKREGLERGIGSILDQIKHVDNVYIIITSREEVFKEFEKEKLTLTELKDFEIRLGIKGPSYNHGKKKKILLNWAEQQDCKWLGIPNLRNSVLDSLEIDHVLPTPLSMHDFAIATKNIENIDKIQEKIGEKSKETRKVFAKEILNMTKDKVVFLCFPFIWSRFEIPFVERLYKEVVDELNIDHPWQFERILKWFMNDKINLREGKYIEFSHPSYNRALEYLLKDQGYDTWVNKEIFGKLLMKLSERDESAVNTAWFMAWQYNSVTENSRNEILLNLSKKDSAAEYTALTLARNFDKVPETTRNEILLKASTTEENSQHHVLSLIKNFDKIPYDIKNDILIKASEKERSLMYVSDILIEKIDMFSCGVLEKLLSNISAENHEYNKVAWAVVRNIEKLSYEVLEKSLVRLSQDSRTDWIVGSGVRDKFGIIPKNLRPELLIGLSKRDGSARYVADIIKKHFNDLSEELRNQLLLIISERDDIAGTVAWIVKDNFNNITEKTRDKLLLNLSEHDGAASFLSLCLENYFEDITESIRNNLLLKLSVKDEAALTIVFILKNKFSDISEVVGNELMIKLSEKDIAEWVVWIINENFNSISENFKSKLLLKLSQNDRSDEAVLITVKANLDKLHSDFLKQIFEELSKSKNEKVATEAKKTEKSILLIERARNLLKEYSIT